MIAVALVAVAVLAGIAYTPEPALPDGLVPPADRYDVRILRDEHGVPHVFGARDPDVAYGLAYAHAEDDFATIQGALLAARGRLASVYGKDAAPNDYMVALLEVRRVVEDGWAELPEDVRALCDAYADGLNHYAALHPDEALARLYPARGQDVVAGFVHKLPLFFGIDKVLGGLLDGTLYDLGDVKGSNAVALAPSKTADGSTVLVVNSHQPWEGPVAWYEAHLRSEDGWDAAGGVFPGAPVVLHGHNRHLGWAHTVNRPDLVDVYRLELDPEDPDRYRFDGAFLPLKRRTAAIEVKLWGPFHWTFEREVLSSVHGPVMRTDHGTFALRFAGWGDARHVEQWYRMNRAENLDDWARAMALQAVPMFHTVYADAAGHIGYVYNARLPARAEGFDYGGFLPGDDSAAVWSHDDPLPFSELPRVWDPASGFVQSCNNTPFATTRGPENPDAESFSAVHGIEDRMTNRSLRALELFGDDPSITDAELLAYKFDTAYHPESAFAGLLDRAVVLDAEGSGGDDALWNEAVDVLRAFDREADVEDPHAALAITALGPFVEPPSTPTDEELRASVLEAAARLREHFGTLEPRWGEVNRLRRGEVDLPLAGAPDVLHAVYGRPDDDGRLRGTAGDSFVMIARWSADGELSSRSLHQYGSATLDAESEHYADQAPLFAERRLKPVWLDEAEIRAHLEREYRPGEEPAPTDPDDGGGS